ncbi:MAG: type II toxin-antitoxin system VapC family toxin [Longimicrobiales bacterium]|nr:type II toxin-antitoxin system VapC family toxin [Longimicrobiales bacterium]
MRVGYLDTSCLVAVAFDEPGGAELGRRLEAYDHLVSSNLLEAEYRAALRREGVEEEITEGVRMLAGLTWVLPNRPLSMEIGRVLIVRYLRGADLWHLATALFLTDTPAEVDFLTLDANQRETAEKLGFPTPVEIG